jgi:hypothetical protein
VQVRAKRRTVRRLRRQIERDFTDYLRGRDLVTGTWYTRDFDELLRLYDYYFFQQQLLPQLRARGVNVQFRLSRRCTETAAYCQVRHACTVVITIGTTTFRRLFETGTGPFRNGGVKCANIVQCIQLTFEQMLVEMITSVFCPAEWAGSKRLYHGNDFYSVLDNWFRQTQHGHEFPTTAWQASTGLRIDDVVNYVGSELPSFRARVVRFNPVTKRVTVKSEDGRTFYIPPHNLKLAVPR